MKRTKQTHRLEAWDIKKTFKTQKIACCKSPSFPFVYSPHTSLTNAQVYVSIPQLNRIYVCAVFGFVLGHYEYPTTINAPFPASWCSFFSHREGPFTYI